MARTEIGLHTRSPTQLAALAFGVVYLAIGLRLAATTRRKWARVASGAIALRSGRRGAGAPGR